MERIEVKFAADEISDAGTFSGYGSVFGNVDSHGDVIAPGAFTETLKVWAGRGRMPAMKLMHGSALNPFNGDDLPLGVWTDMREDERGLYVEGKISAIDTDFGRRIHGLMKDGALDGLSIGYRVKRAAKGDGKTGPRRTLQEIILLEVSVVDDPSNGLARVGSVKSQDVRDLEASLRDAGLSRNDAKKAVACFREWSPRDAEAPVPGHRDDGAADLAALLRGNIATLSR